MPAGLEKNLETFPNQDIQPIIRQLFQETIAKFNLKLYTNAASVHYHIGNEILVLLFLPLKPEVYNTQSSIVFIPPINPFQHPTIPAGSIGNQITKLWRQHKAYYDEFYQY